MLFHVKFLLMFDDDDDDDDKSERSKLTFLMESFPAELAHKRFVSRVDARVRVECRAAIEGFPALVTFVRFFLRHNNKMRSFQSPPKESGLFQRCTQKISPANKRTVRIKAFLSFVDFQCNAKSPSTIIKRDKIIINSHVFGNIREKWHLYWFYWFSFRQNYS